MVPTQKSVQLSLSLDVVFDSLSLCWGLFRKQTARSVGPPLPSLYCLGPVTDTLFFGLRKAGAQQELIPEPFN